METIVLSTSRLLPLLLLLLLLAVSPARCDLTPEEKDEILAAHNDLRQAIATNGSVGSCTYKLGVNKAANMKLLEWDDRLAEDAERLACQCKMQHDTQADRQVPGYSHVGQNIAADWGGSPPSMTSRVRRWFDECIDYTYSTGGCTAGKACGHYTQVVWAATTLVGCGFKDCGSGGRYLVCNYAPAGNFNGQKPYVQGAEASECEPGYEMSYSGVCLRVDQCEEVEAKCSVDACSNGGVRGDGCSCICPPGSAGLKCQKPCANHPSYDSACKSLASQNSLDCKSYSSICTASCGMCSPKLEKDEAVVNVDHINFKAKRLHKVKSP